MVTSTLLAPATCHACLDPDRAPFLRNTHTPSYCIHTCDVHCPVSSPAPGSGKTLAYLLPGLACLVAGNSNKNSEQQQAAAAGNTVQPRVLILTPSRELAQQVHGQAVALFGVSAVSSAVVFGGVPKEQQVSCTGQTQPGWGTAGARHRRRHGVAGER